MRHDVVDAVGYALALTLLFGLLAGVLVRLSEYSVLGMTGHYHLDVAFSGPGPRIAHSVLDAATVAAGLLYLVVPLGGAAALASGGDHHPAVYVAAGGAALLAAPGIAAAVLLFRIPNGGWIFLAGVAVLVAGLAGAALARRRSGEPLPLLFANQALLIVVLVGVVVGGAPVGSLADDTVETQRVGQHPDLTATYESVDDDRGLLTVRYTGFGRTHPDRIRLAGDGFANVGGADQTEPGPWQGSTTVEDGIRTVSEGDMVTVGVTDDCEIQVVYRYDGGKTVVDAYECATLRRESG